MSDYNEFEAALTEAGLSHDEIDVVWQAANEQLDDFGTLVEE